jgi:hypothetical protein
VKASADKYRDGLPVDVTYSQDGQKVDLKITALQRPTIEKTFSITNNWVDEFPPHTQKSTGIIDNFKYGLKDWAHVGLDGTKNDLVGPDVTPKFFGGISSGPANSINDATIHFHVGHGYPPDNNHNGNTALQLLRSTEGNSKYEGYQFFPSDVQNKWGGNNKWVVLQSCLVLSDPDWGKVLGTTHQIFGYSTVTWMDDRLAPEVSRKFIAYAKKGDTLYDSWFLATKEEYSGHHVGKVVQLQSGQYVLDDKQDTPLFGAVRFKTLDQRDQDHLPGTGGLVASEGDPGNTKSYLTKWNCDTGETVTEVTV